ncbi:MAG: C40 family peptidase [Acidovorax soli]|uniref:C40 family peptidase n=1 Tax=Acidovorax soli TaxID=592050 RepID=UPI0026F2DFA3|nr:C40 family peptidase [Acidovorax soli]MCM2347280.1 C40 family peptidase [Acidovorax soli]
MPIFSPHNHSRRHALQGLALACTLLLGGCSTAPSSSSSALLRSAASQLSNDQAHDIAIHALGLVGTPYRYGGNTPDTGFDCSGLIGYVYRHRVGTAPPRTVAQLSGWGQPIANGDLRSGDLVVFGAGPAPTHAGIYVGEGRFVHAPSTGGTVRLDQFSSGYWARQKASFRRL